MNFTYTLRHLITSILICCCWHTTMQPGAVRGGREYEKKQREKIRTYYGLENELAKFADILDKAENEALLDHSSPATAAAVQAAQDAWQQVQNAIGALKKTGLKPTTDQQSRIDNLKNRLDILEAYVAKKVTQLKPSSKPPMSKKKRASEVAKDMAAENAARKTADDALKKLEKQISIIETAVKNLPAKPTQEALTKISALMPENMLKKPQQAVTALENFPGIDAAPYQKRLDALIQRGATAYDQLAKLNKKMPVEAPRKVRPRGRTLSEALSKSPFAPDRRPSLPARLTGEAVIFEPVVVEEASRPGPETAAPVPARPAAISRPSRVSTPQELTTEQKNLQRMQQAKQKKSVMPKESEKETYAVLLTPVQEKIVKIKQTLNEYFDNQQALKRYQQLKDLSTQLVNVQEEIKNFGYLRRLIPQQFLAVEQQPSRLQKQIEDYYLEELKLIDTDIELINSTITRYPKAGDIERARLTPEINSLLEKLDQELAALPPEKVKQQRENLERLKENFKEAQKPQPGLFEKIKAAVFGSEKPQRLTPQNVEDVLQLHIDSIAQSTPVTDMEETARSFATGIRVVKDDKKRANLLYNFVKNITQLDAGNIDKSIRGRVQAAFWEAEDDANIRELVQPYFSYGAPLPLSFRPLPLASIEEESEEEEEAPEVAPLPQKPSTDKKTGPQEIQPTKVQEPQKIEQPKPKESAQVVAAKAELERLAAAIEDQKKHVIEGIIKFPNTFDAQEFTTYKSALDKAMTKSTKDWAKIQDLVAQIPEFASQEEEDAYQEPKFTMDKFLVLQRQAEYDNDFIANLNFYLNPNPSAIMPASDRMLLLHTVFKTLDEKIGQIRTIAARIKGTSLAKAYQDARQQLKSIKNIITKNKSNITEKLLIDFSRQAQYEISKIEKFIVAKTPEEKEVLEEKEFELKIPEKKPSAELRTKFNQLVGELSKISSDARHDTIKKFLDETDAQKDERLLLVNQLTASEDQKARELSWDLWLEIDFANRIRGWENWEKEIAKLTKKMTTLDKEIARLKETGADTNDKEKERSALEMERGEAIEQRDNLMLTKSGTGSFLETLKILKKDKDITDQQKQHFKLLMNKFIRSRPRTQPFSQPKPQAQDTTLPLPKAPSSSSGQEKIVKDKILKYCAEKSDALWAEIEKLLSTTSSDFQKQARTTYDLVQQIDQYKKTGNPEATTLDQTISSLTSMPNVQILFNDLVLEAQITRESTSGSSDASKKMQGFLDQISNQTIIKRVIKDFGEKFKLEETEESTGSLKVRKEASDLPSAVTDISKKESSGTMQIGVDKGGLPQEVMQNWGITAQ